MASDRPWTAENQLGWFVEEGSDSAAGLRGALAARVIPDYCRWDPHELPSGVETRWNTPADPDSCCLQAFRLRQCSVQEQLLLVGRFSHLQRVIL